MKTNYTTAEIRNPQRTKHNSDGKTKYSLWNIALEAIRSVYYCMSQSDFSTLLIYQKP